MDRRKISDVLFYALQCAKEDRLSFADANHEGTKEYKQAIADIKLFENLQIMIFGTSKSEMDAAQDGMKSFNIADLRDMLKDNPEIFQHAEGCQCEYCKTK